MINNMLRFFETFELRTATTRTIECWKRDGGIYGTLWLYQAVLGAPESEVWQVRVGGQLIAEKKMFGTALNVLARNV